MHQMKNLVYSMGESLGLCDDSSGANTMQRKGSGTPVLNDPWSHNAND
jgi:hypothetical protein